MLDHFYSIGPRDRRGVALLFSYGFGNAAAYVLARTIADSAFLSHIGPEHLPPLYLLAAGVVALSSVVYGHLVGRIRLRQLVLLTQLALAATSAMMPAVMHRFSHSLTVFSVVYLLAQIRGSLGTIQYVTLLNERFGDNKPERVVGLIGAGATLAGITMGLAIGLIADRVDVEGLMYLTAAVDLVTMIPVALLRTSAKPRGLPDDAELLSPELSYVTNQYQLRDAWKSAYVRSISGVVLLSVIAATLVQYQWKVTASGTFHRDVEDLARYFGYFYGTVYLLTGLLQLFVTGQVLERRGMLAGLLAFPAALLAATATAWLVSAERLLLWPITLSKGCDTLKRSMNDAAVQILYSPLSPALRRQAITLVAGIAKPFAEALAALVLVALTPWMSARELSLVVIATILIWLTVDIRAWRHFVRLRPTSAQTKLPG